MPKPNRFLLQIFFSCFYWGVFFPQILRFFLVNQQVMQPIIKRQNKTTPPQPQTTHMLKISFLVYLLSFYKIVILCKTKDFLSKNFAWWKKYLQSVLLET